MKVLLVFSVEAVESTSKPLHDLSSMQFGLSYVSSILKTQGHQTHLVVLGSNIRWKTNVRLLKSSIEDVDPQVIGFTAVASQFPFICKIANWIKSEWPNIYLISGGVHTTLNPEEVIQESFDALCIGEGEFPMVELCNQLETTRFPSQIANLWIRSPDGSIEKNPTRGFLQQIDELPFPDREIWRPWVKEPLGNQLLAGRGCPYNCTYCCNHSLKNAAKGKYVRMRSPETIIKELSSLHAKYPAQSHFYFEVESIALHKEWVFELCDLLVGFNSSIKNAISYGCNFRISPQSVDEKLFTSLEEANFKSINIGLESGSERIRREILKRYYSNQTFLDVVAVARAHGFKIWVYNMIGVPGETYCEHMETVDLNRRCQPDAHLTSIFFPYPGTDLHDECVKRGLIEDPVDPRCERRRARLDLPEFSRKQIQRAYILFNYRVYRNYRSFWWLMIRTLHKAVTSFVVMDLLFRKMIQFPILRDMRERLARIWTRDQDRAGVNPADLPEQESRDGPRSETRQSGPFPANPHCGPLAGKKCKTTRSVHNAR